MRAGVTVKPVFSGNQEATVGLLRHADVAAAGVNNTVIQNFSRRAAYSYRVLWTSALYHDLCIMANPRVPKDKIAAVQAALVGMTKDPAGRKILIAGAELLKIEDEPGFVAADNRDYDPYRVFYRQTRLKPYPTDTH